VWGRQDDPVADRTLPGHEGIARLTKQLIGALALINVVDAVGLQQMRRANRLVALAQVVPRKCTAFLIAVIRPGDTAFTPAQSAYRGF
jgi:hypothetical protein